MDQEPRRYKLNALLVELLGSDHVYFQPPASVSMKYPAIVYDLDDRDTNYADNLPFNSFKRYSVTVLDPDPDSPVSERIAMLPRCKFSRRYAVDGLNHDVYTFYY